MALANAGCHVEAVCPPRHPLETTSSVSRTHTYRGLAPLMSFRSAIAAAKPDFIVPGDDLATQHLHHLYRQEQRNGKTRPLCALIERSLGAPESFPVVYERSAFMKAAQEEGIRVPETEVIADLEGLRQWVARVGLPTVLKTDGTSGGDGVRVVHTLAEAEHAFRVLQAPPILPRAAKRALVDRDKTLVWPSLLRRRFVVNAQAFVAGSEATSTIACWKGSMLAGLHFEVVNKRDSSGPASVVRSIDDPEMSAAAAGMVRRLNLSGMHGFDFMRETSSGHAYLIEINPRVTQVGHLTLGPGRDLPAALYSALSGEPLQVAPKMTENDIITLFPQEWLRDPASAFLRSGYHDVPWEEPGLLRACLRKGKKQNTWYSQQKAIQIFSTARVPRP